MFGIYVSFLGASFNPNGLANPVDRPIYLRYAAIMSLPDLTHLAIDGAFIEVRVTPKASRNTVVVEESSIRVYVTTVPEDGKATADVQKLLAKCLGISKSSLSLVRGATARDKVFQVNL